MSLSKEVMPSRWEGVAYHGSNCRPSSRNFDSSFYQQLENLPDEMIKTMFSRIENGVQQFDNVKDVVEVVDSQLLTVNAPSVGFQEYNARLLVAGDHPDLGIPNPHPWTASETIIYATVSGTVWEPSNASARIAQEGKEFSTLDALFWKTLLDEQMHDKVVAVLERRGEIFEAESVPRIIDIYERSEAVVSQ